MITRIQIRRGTAAAWTSANPTLAAGEAALETDTRKTKMGDGTTPWTSLPYDEAGTGEDLGNPAVSGAVLTSTDAGVRSWTGGILTVGLEGHITTGNQAYITTGGESFSGAGDAGYIQTSTEGYIQTSTGGYIFTAPGGSIITGNGAYIITGNGAYIITGNEAYIQTGPESFPGAGDAGYIYTSTGGSIFTSPGGYIYTAPGGSITTGTTPVNFVSGVTIDQGGTGATNAGAARTNLGAGTTGNALFTAATPEDARSALGIARKITVADVSRNNAGTGSTYTTDATLSSFAVEANTWYLVEFAFMFSCTAAAGIKLQFTHPALATSAAFSGRLVSPAAPVDIVANSSTITSLTNQTALRAMAAMTGYFRIRIGAAGGDLALQWAQVNSLVDLTTLHAGSLVTVTKI